MCQFGTCCIWACTVNYFVTALSSSCLKPCIQRWMKCSSKSLEFFVPLSLRIRQLSSPSQASRGKWKFRQSRWSHRSYANLTWSARWFEGLLLLTDGASACHLMNKLSHQCYLLPAATLWLVWFSPCECVSVHACVNVVLETPAAAELPQTHCRVVWQVLF